MKLPWFNKTKTAAGRLADEALYAAALREIESGQRRDGLWAQALSECNMDYGKAAARYIDLRVQAMKDEQTVLSALAAEEYQREVKQRKEEELQRIADAESDLPKHPKCGGVIDRIERGTQVKWRCRKCRASGMFVIGWRYSAGAK